MTYKPFSFNQVLYSPKDLPPKNPATCFPFFIMITYGVIPFVSNKLPNVSTTELSAGEVTFTSSLAINSFQMVLPRLIVNISRYCVTKFNSF